MDLFTAFFVLFIIFCLISAIKLNYFDKSQKQGKQIPGPKAWPIIGNALDFMNLDLPGLYIYISKL